MIITKTTKLRKATTLAPVELDPRNIGDQVSEICKGDQGLDVLYEMPPTYDPTTHKLDNIWYRMGTESRACTCGLIELTGEEKTQNVIAEIDRQLSSLDGIITRDSENFYNDPSTATSITDLPQSRQDAAIRKAELRLRRKDLSDGVVSPEEAMIYETTQQGYISKLWTYLTTYSGVY